MNFTAKLPSPHPDPLPSHPMGAEREQQLGVSPNLGVSLLSPGLRALIRFNDLTL